METVQGNKSSVIECGNLIFLSSWIACYRATRL